MDASRIVEVFVSRRPFFWAHAFCATTLLVSIGSAVAALPEVEHVISQKDRRFQPGGVSLHPGEKITVVNDDSDLTHHAYIDSPTFSYDSGDQGPGARAVIAFPKAGDFMVLCAIHPKMKLTVHVQ